METQPESNSTPETTSAAPRTTGGANAILIPVAILVGFGMIAAAIFFSNSGGSAQLAANPDDTNNRVQETDSGSPDAVNPVTEDDWIRGNPNAPIQIVEYSDFDCPFCKNFHETMNQIMAEYGSTGEVAWVYRHFPLAQLHPNAPQIALASECVGNIGGTEAFWEFSDLVFGERETNAQTNITRLEEFAESSGVSAEAFNTCVENQEYTANVEEDYNNAVAVGGRGTPHSVIIIGDQTGVINGAQPYGSVKQIVDNLLSQLEGGGQG